MSERDSTKPNALRYQEQRGLDDVPAYMSGLQLQLPDGPRVYVALSATELALYFDSNRALHYDLNGRLVKVADPDQYWRRSLSGRMLYSRKLTAEEGGGLARQIVPADEAEALLAGSNQQVVAVGNALRDSLATIEFGRPDVPTALPRILPALDLAAKFDVGAARLDAARFEKIYGRVAILPPDQYNALVLQATEGCAYNGCKFCELYRGVTHRKKSLEEFREHLNEAVRYHGPTLRARRSIFLGEANALTQPTSILKEFLHAINDRFDLPAPETPSSGVSASWWLGSERRFDGVSSFLDAFTNQNRTTNDYHDLRRSGLRRVYIGLETGNVDLLKWLRKPATPEAVIKCVRMMKECDIIVGVIVLVGAGGQEHAAAHVQDTVQVLNEMPLSRNDYVYFSPLVVYPDSQYDTQAMSDRVAPLSVDEMRQQELEFRAGLRFDARRGRPYLARYELETFVY